MKLIIAGSRPKYIKVAHGLLNYICGGFDFNFDTVTDVVCGYAQGVDTKGRLWAQREGIPVKLFPADWDNYPKIAGLIRNEQMGDYADALLLIWDGKSSGSAGMKNI